jgi:TolA-binding protein
MKHIIIIFLILTPLIFSGCSADKAGDMFETAKFEELQNNHEHAQELYRKIIKDYPESELAKKAKDRLLELKDK